MPLDPFRECLGVIPLQRGHDLLTLVPAPELVSMLSNPIGSQSRFEGPEVQLPPLIFNVIDLRQKLLGIALEKPASWPCA